MINQIERKATEKKPKQKFKSSTKRREIQTENGRRNVVPNRLLAISFSRKSTKPTKRENKSLNKEEYSNMNKFIQ